MFNKENRLQEQEDLHSGEKGVSDWKHRIKNTVTSRVRNRKTQKE